MKNHLVASRGREGSQLINPHRLFHGVWLPQWLEERPEVSEKAKKHAYLTYFAGGKVYAWPSFNHLAERLHISRRYVIKLVQELSAHRLITATHVDNTASRSKTGTKRVRRYFKRREEAAAYVIRVRQQGFVHVEERKIRSKRMSKTIVRPRFPSIVAIYETGGRLPHALVELSPSDSKQAWDRKRDELLQSLIIRGADPKRMTGVRLSRLPAMRALRQV